MTSDLDDLPERERRVCEALAAYFEAARAGQAPAREAYLAAHPDLADELAAFLEDEDRLLHETEALRSAVGHAAENVDPGKSNGTIPATGALLKSTIDDFEIEAEIARGGMGVVYRAHQRSLNRPVALKMLRAGPLADAEEVRRFRLEAESAAILDHPHIVPIYEVGVRGGLSYLAMKLVEGESLARRMGRDRDDPRAAASLVASVARAVHHAHQRGILHRDLKPSNILIDAQGQPHVTDFGLAKRVGSDPELTQSGAILGSPPYMAPEQAEGVKGSVTVATDVYGLGAILYALLTGRPPFQAETPLATLDQVRTREPDPPSTINQHVERDLQSICLKCLEKDPRQRYGSAVALAEDLEHWLLGEPIAARRAGRLERAWRWCRRNPGVAGLTSVIGLLLLLTAVGSTVGLFRLAREKRLSEAHQRRAEANFRRARDAVDAMLTEVGTKTLATVPQMTPVRRALLEKALAFYEDLLRERSSDPAMRLEIGRALRRVGSIYDDLGRDEQTRFACRKSIELLERLAWERPRDPGPRRELAFSYNVLGFHLTRTAPPADAERAWRAALRLSEDLIRERGSEVVDRMRMADTSLALGGLLLNQDGRLEDAEAILRRALGVGERVVAEAPRDSEARIILGKTLSNLGVLKMRQGRPGEARPLLERAIAEKEAALRIDPARKDVPLDVGSRDSYAGSLGMLGLCLHQLGEYDRSIELLRRQVALMEETIAEFPQEQGHRLRLVYALSNLIHPLRSTGRRHEAAAASGRAANLIQDLIDQYPGSRSYQEIATRVLSNHGGMFSDWGDCGEAVKAYRRALELLESLLRSQPDGPEYRKQRTESRAHLAEILAICHDPAVRDPAQAVVLARQIVADEPAHASYWSVLGSALFATGKPKDALEAYEKSLALDRGDQPVTWFLLARVHGAIGNRLEARDWFDKGMDWMERKKSTDARLIRVRDEAKAALDGPSPAQSQR
jgi:serine/threonine-protein kinase